MKDKETEYLNNLFAMSPGEADEPEVDFPLMDVPANLTENLYAITKTTPASSQPIWRRISNTWPKVASVAVTFLAAIVLFQVYQQQQTLKQLEQAQTDLATALHYLSEANEITRAQMRYSLNTSVKKAAVVPVMEIGRDTVLPTLKSLESEPKTPTRTL